jgi:hypothetical protein
MASKRKSKKTAKKSAKRSAKKSKSPVSRRSRPAPAARGKQLTDTRFTEAFVREFLGPKITCKWMASQEVAAYLSDFAALVGVLTGSGFPHGSGVEVKDTPAAQRLRQLIQVEGWPSGGTAETLNDILLCIGRLLHCVVVLNTYSWPPKGYERWPPHV